MESLLKFHHGCHPGQELPWVTEGKPWCYSAKMLHGHVVREWGNNLFIVHNISLCHPQIGADWARAIRAASVSLGKTPRQSKTDEHRWDIYCAWSKNTEVRVQTMSVEVLCLESKASLIHQCPRSNLQRKMLEERLFHAFPYMLLLLYVFYRYYEEREGWGNCFYSSLWLSVDS